MTYREHEKHSLEVAELVLFDGGIESRRRGTVRGGVNRGTASGRELKEQNPLVVVVKVADSPPLEPLLRLLVVDEQRRVEVAGGEGVGVDDAVEELRRIVVPPRDEADDHHAVGGARERRRRRRRRMVGGGGGGGGGRRRRANEDSNR